MLMIIRQKITVLFLIDNMRVGGTELNALRTAAELDSQHVRLRVACLSSEGPLTKRYGELGIDVLNLSLKSFFGWSMLTAGWTFVRYLRSEHVDIVHAHDIYSNIFAAVWARAGKVRAVIASRRWWHSLPNKKLQAGNRLAFRRADAIVANSPAIAESVREESGVPGSKVWTITNFVDESGFGNTPEQRERILTGWGISASCIVVGCVARLEPVKDHETLIRAFRLVQQNQPQARLVLVGGGAAREALQSLVRQLGIDQVVHFTGEVEPGFNYHRGFDISALSSRSEGFPNSIVEAMAAGNPVIATAVGGCLDAVVHGVTGALVPSGDASAFAKELAALIGDVGQRERMGRAGFERARNNYSKAAAITTLERMYEQLVARGA